MVLANLWLQINATFDHPQNIGLVHLFGIVYMESGSGVGKNNT